MITGFNTDIEHDGVVYHVQTEDKGLASPLILSLVYSGGAILASKRSPYQDLIAAGFDEEVLSERLRQQHRLICAAITAGRIDELKRLGARVESEEKAAPSAGQAQEGNDRMVVETSSERPPVAAERPGNDRMVVETSSERPPVAAEPTVTYLSRDISPEAEALPKSQRRSHEKESAYTVYDPRRKSPMGALAESENGLVLTVLDEGEFYAGESFTIRILLQNRSGKKEKPVSGVTLSLRILGNTFRPQIFSVKTGRDGVGVVSGQIPHFRSGRAAIVIRAVLDDSSAEVRRVIHPAA